MKARNLLVGLGVAVALALGAGTAAQAAVATTSMSDWTTGTTSSARTASSSSASQSITLNGCVWSTPTGGGATSPKQQLQLQTPNVFSQWVSLGNITGNCGSNLNWGAQGSGNFRYQLNGVYDTSNYYHGTAGSYLFSASPVYIYY